MYKKKTISSGSNYSFVLPSSFDANDYLKGSLAKRADDANYIISTIYRRQAMGAGHGEDDFVRLHAATLNKIVAKDDTKKILDALIPGAINCDKHYVVGSHSRGYRLNQKFVGDKCVRIKPTNPRLLRALERENLRRRNGGQYDHIDPKTPDLCQRLEMQFHRIEINIDHATELISKLPIESNPFDQQSVIVHDLYAKQFQVFSTRWGRIYNSISGLHSLVRPALQFNGKRLVSVDVKNSQPALLGLKVLQCLKQSQPNLTPTSRNHKVGTGPHPRCPLLPRQPPYSNPNPDSYPDSYPNPSPPPLFLSQSLSQSQSQSPILLYDSEKPLVVPTDLELFISEVSEGRFYEAFLGECNTKGLMVATVKGARTKRTMERQDAKDGFMMHVLAKDGAYPSEYREVFANRYPTIDAHIILVNRWSHKTLIRKLQGLEAKFVIHNVAAGALLLPSNPLVLTLHDCIICGEGQAELIVGEFDRGFNEIGYRMVVSVEPF